MIEVVFNEVRDLKSDIRTVAGTLVHDADSAKAYLDLPRALGLYCRRPVPKASILDNRISKIADSLLDLEATDYPEVRQYAFFDIEGFKRKSNISYANRVTDKNEQRKIKQSMKDVLVQVIFRQVLDELNTTGPSRDLSLVKALGILNLDS